MSDSSQGPGWWIASDGKWYPPQPPSPPAPPRTGGSTPTEAIVSLIVGIVGIVACGCWGVGLLLGGVGVYLGNSAKKKIAASDGALGGASLAQAGFVCSIIAVVLGAIGVVLLIIAIATGNTSFDVSTNS